jgi:hypothetical protein
MVVPGAASIAGRGRRQRNSTAPAGRFPHGPCAFQLIYAILHVAFDGDIEYRALLAIEQMLDCKAEPCVADASAVQGWLKSRELQGRGADQGFENICQHDEITRITSSYATKCRADDARVTRCGEYIWVRVEGGFDTANLLFRRAQHCE